MPDHLGWWPVSTYSGEWCRLASGNARGPEILTSPRLATRPRALRFEHLCLPKDTKRILPNDVYRRLTACSPLVRLSTPTVWEAAATAVIRQVVHRNQARVSFQRICERFGATTLIDGHLRYAFPTAETIVTTSESQLRETGIGFKARTLQTLAAWASDANEHLAADEMYEALTSLRGVGDWTASVTLCDFFSDFRYYPVEDLAVRAQVRALWPRRRWPSAPLDFADAWRSITAPYTDIVTAFVLADALLS